MREVHQKIDHLQKNAEIAGKMDLDSSRVKFRLLAIAAIALFGLIGSCVATWAIIVGALNNEREKALASLILLACIGIMIAAVTVFVSVVWNRWIIRNVKAI